MRGFENHPSRALSAGLGAALLLALPGAAAGAESTCGVVEAACRASVHRAAQACRYGCLRGDSAARSGCLEGCEGARVQGGEACGAVESSCRLVCGADGATGARAVCLQDRVACRAQARRTHAACRASCPTQADRGASLACLAECERERAADETGCSFVVVRASLGAADVPVLPIGRPADLSLLEPAERAVVANADARAPALRTRPVRLWVGAPGTEVTVTQTRHGFPFGIPIDLRRFTDPDDLAWYGETMAAHFDLAVLENNAKWAKVEPAEGVRVYEFVDADVAWAESLGFRVKGHTLLWGILPFLSTSGVPGWVFDRFGSPSPTPAQQEELRALLRRHVFDLVGRYRGRIALWDVTNETLQPVARWFVERLGPGIVDDMFRWAHEADPAARLVFNEWIVEVFTGPLAPTAADVRDRVLELRAAGVPVHALGQQSHFVPAAAFAGFPVDLGQRTRIDDYAVALDTLAEAGLPVHVTETNFIAPAEPEARAAQAEALMRLWWGHPAVEQVVFWGPWNQVAGRDEFDVGLWDDARKLSRHGEAVLSLLNDRWRTKLVAAADAHGLVELRAHHGAYVAEWTADGVRVHATFQVEPGSGSAAVALLGP